MTDILHNLMLMKVSMDFPRREEPMITYRRSCKLIGASHVHNGCPRFSCRKGPSSHVTTGSYETNTQQQQLEVMYGEPAELEVGLVQAAPEPSSGAGRHRLTQQHLSAPDVRMVTYNILADQYASQEHSQKVLFSFCPFKCAPSPPPLPFPILPHQHAPLPVSWSLCQLGGCF